VATGTPVGFRPLNVDPTPPAEGIVLAWTLEPSRVTGGALMAGPMVLLEAMARAVTGAGQGLAAPGSLLLSLTVVLVIDRERLMSALRRKT
jgi:hypothetical protein